MAVKITTGEYTQVVVSNKKGWSEILTATEFNADASARTEEVRAFNDLGEPLVISTDMGQTTGRISIIRSSTLPFEALAMGKAITYASDHAWNLGTTNGAQTITGFTNFTLKDAISNPIFLIANYKDKITKKIYASQFITMAFLNSDGTNEAVNGTLATTFSFTATAKWTYNKAIAIGSYEAHDADTNKITADTAWYDSTGTGHDILPGGTADDGSAIEFRFNPSSGAYEAAGAGTQMCWLTTTGM